jgi:hypothetical protein
MEIKQSEAPASTPFVALRFPRREPSLWPFGQFLIQIPLIPMPAKLVYDGLGYGLSFVLAQPKAQSADYFPS